MMVAALRAAIVLTLFALPCGRSAAAEFPADLAGYSVQAERVETISYPGNSFRQHWVERVYFSTQGRVFSKETLTGNPMGPVAQARISDRSDSNSATFSWNGSGVSRQFTNPRNGVVLLWSITISKSAASWSCAASLSRQNAGGFQVAVERESCRVVKGNLVAD